jgi:hypothetical protein
MPLQTNQQLVTQLPRQSVTATSRLQTLSLFPIYLSFSSIFLYVHLYILYVSLTVRDKLAIMCPASGTKTRREQGAYLGGGRRASNSPGGALHAFDKRL